jgi:hypothetical protein
MKLVYDEWYGTLSYAQRAAYRKHNISPSDHDFLVDRFGPDAHQEITDEVKRQCADGGMFSFMEIGR